MLTGDMYIGDVGAKKFDEINFIPAGGAGAVNFGWKIYEGTELYPGYPGKNPPFGIEFESPVWQQPVNKDGTCALIGGDVYRGDAIPELYGSYIFGDFCSGFIWKLDKASNGEWEAEIIYDTSFLISSFGVDEAGELYLTDFIGTVYQLIP